MSTSQKTHISLTKSQQLQVKIILKQGIYKELHKKKLLSHSQLDELLNNRR